MRTQQHHHLRMRILQHLQSEAQVAGWFALEADDPTHGPATRVGLLEASQNDVMRTRIAKRSLVTQQDLTGVGWVVALPYEISTPPLVGYAPASLLVPHQGQEPYLVGDVGSGSYRKLAHILDMSSASVDIVPDTEVDETVYTVKWRDDEAVYRERVEGAKAWARNHAGGVLCLTNSVHVQVHAPDGIPSNIDPLRVYERIMVTTPSPHQAIISLGSEAFVSASPELFMRVRDGQVMSQPMKGTRSRGATAEEDAHLREELSSSVKETLENSAVTDALTDQLQEVCAPGTVRCETQRVVSFPRVHQLISDVTGKLREGTTLETLLCHTFPAASMTGVPHREAITELSRLEDAPRGLYSGCYGWVGECGDVELAMSIRSAHIRGHEATIGAGGGITALSEPEEEIAEVRLKARAVLETVAPGITAEGEAGTQRKSGAR